MPAVQTVQDVEEFVGIAAEQRSGQHHGAIARGSQRPQGVSLRRLTALQLVNFVRDAVVEESIHVPADELHRRHPVDLVIVRLPERAEECFPGLRCDSGQTVSAIFDFPEVCAPELVLAEEHRQPGIGIHHVPVETAASRPAVCMPPEITQLGPLPRYDEHRRSRICPASALAPIDGLRQPHVAQRGFQTLANDSAVAKPDLIHARESIRATPLRHPSMMKTRTPGASERLPRTIFRRAAAAPSQDSERPCIGVCEHAAKRDERLSSSAFRHGRSTSSLLPTLDDSHDGHACAGNGRRFNWQARETAAAVAAAEAGNRENTFAEGSNHICGSNPRWTTVQP